MELDQRLELRQIPSVAVFVWGQPRVGATLLFFGTEFLVVQHTLTTTTTTTSVSRPRPRRPKNNNTNSKDGQEAEGDEEEDIIHFPYQAIQSLTRLGDRDVMVYFRTFGVMMVTMSQRDHATAFVNNIQQILLNATVEDLPAFSFHPSETSDNNPFANADGWDLYNMEAQLQRMGLPSASWRVTDMNQNFLFCDTYPQKLVVPVAVDDATLQEVAKFRDRRRIPVLCYYFRQTQAAICRSGQPLIGAKHNHSAMDEAYFLELGKCNRSNSNPPSILDGRTRNTANLAFNKGGGVENPKRYGQCHVVQANLEHPYVLSEYLSKLLSACRNRNVQLSDWLSDSGNWLTQVQNVLRMANAIARAIARDSRTVLVHCEDDSDTAPLLISCAKLLLDPFYRTYTGFQVLLEEDWIKFGFKFADRCEQLKTDSDPVIKPTYPYFALFMDAVFQMLNQCQSSFEFNEAYLFTIFENAHSCRYGTLLLNCERLRAHYNLPKLTSSLWTYLNSQEQKARLSNVFYRPRIQTDGTSLLAVDYDARSLAFWNGFYNPWSTKSSLQIQLKSGVDPVYEALRDRSLKIRSSIQRLKDQIDALRNESDATSFDPLGAIPSGSS